MNKNSVFFNRIVSVILSMRPKQWIKNTFVFAGLVFSKSFLDMSLVLRSIYAFLIFSMVSGAVYIINDIVDRDKDRLHPEKSKRPVAAGKLKPFEALLYSVAIAALAFLFALLLDFRLFIILVSYFVLVCLYSLLLKHVIIVDVILIAFGFVLRTLGGTAVINVEISPWLIMCTTLLALFLALNKRKNELAVLSEEAASHRKILEKYTPQLIDQMLGVVTSATVMSYSLYTFDAGKSNYMMITIPFVLYGIFRYQYLVSHKNMGGSPETVLLRDKPLLLDIILWGITSLIVVRYFY